MPSRWLRWLIILFWLATTGWLFWHDLRPQWLTGEPPSLRPDDVDEVNGPALAKTTWTVQRQKDGNIEVVFTGTTSVKYQSENDTYAFFAELHAVRAEKGHEVYAGKIFKIDRMTSEYRVDREGRLRSLKARVDVTPQPDQLGAGVSALLAPLLSSKSSRDAKGPPIADGPSLSFTLQGVVDDNQFFARCRAEGAALANPLQFDLPPTAMTHTGSVLMPLHPINHIRGLYPGRSWRQPLVDPLRDAFASFPGFSGGVRWLNAHVLPQPELLTVSDKQTKCLVIEYTNDENETIGRTWVDKDSERVLQQEAILDDGHWIMKRELERRSGKQRLLDQ